MQMASMMSFTEISIWIQCYNLPLIFMHKDSLEKLGKHLGVVEEIDTKENVFAMGRYARVKVRIDITKPLKQHVRLSYDNGKEEIIVILSYEWLLDFYYNCGLIGHSFRDCDMVPPVKGKLSFGSWLKASPRSGGSVKSRQPSPPKLTSNQQNLSTENLSRDSEEKCESASSGHLHHNVNVVFASDQENGMKNQRNINTEDETFVSSKEQDQLDLPELHITHSQILNEQISLQTISHKELINTIQVGPDVQHDVMECATKTQNNDQKKWKRRAREKGSSSEPNHSLYSLNSIIGDEDLRINMKKRVIEEPLDGTSYTTMARVAKQPHRQQ